MQMDKASIVGDAVLYVQQLQIQAKKLKAEIAGLESSLVLGAERYNGLVEIPKKIQVARSHHPMGGKIFQVCKFVWLLLKVRKVVPKYLTNSSSTWVWICRWMCFKWRKEGSM